MSISSNRGISLLTVVIMISVLGVSLTVTRILLYRQKHARRELETRREMKEIYGATTGNPETRTFGYLGDMGAPPVSLSGLIANPGASSAAIGVNGVKVGWSGPYINVGRDLESYRRDAWGNDYSIVGVCQIHSNGPDGLADTPDDIVFPAKSLDSFTGSLVLRVPKGGVLCNVTDVKEIAVYYSVGGIERQKVLATDFDLSAVEGEGYYATDPIPLHHGIHAVKVTDSIGNTVYANVDVFAGSTHSQTVGTLPHNGIHISPLTRPHISLDDNRVVEINIVNATGCKEGEGAFYDVSRIDVSETGAVGGANPLLEISFDGTVVFTGIAEMPASVTLSATHRLQPGQGINRLRFGNIMRTNSTFVLTYYYTDAGEPAIQKSSTIRFRIPQA